MQSIVCKRSGLVFEAENRRKSVHPQISKYTSHKDMDVRYAPIVVAGEDILVVPETIERYATVKRNGDWWKCFDTWKECFDEDGCEVDEGDYAFIVSTRCYSKLRKVNFNDVAQWVRQGHNIDPDLIAEACAAGHLSQSEAMNSDF
jgi:hypothetical protein